MLEARCPVPPRRIAVSGDAAGTPPITQAQFVRPEELEQAAAACGLAPGERGGVAYLPAIHRAWWTRSLAVNYIASLGKSGDATSQGRFIDSPFSTGKG